MTAKSKTNLHVAGNSLATRAAMEQHLQKLGAALVVLDSAAYEDTDTRPLLTGLTVRIPQVEGAEVLVVLKGTQGAEKVVAFHSDDAISTALKGAALRFRNNSLKWKEDVPYNARSKQNMGSG